MMLRLLRALVDGLTLRCPRCHRGWMYPRPFSYHMRKTCPVCGLAFEPDVGEMTGGMAVNMVLTSILGTAVAIYLALFSHLSAPALALALVVGPLLFGLWFHPHARGAWVGVLYATDALIPPHARTERPRPASAPRS